jgi:hypothetical protein
MVKTSGELTRERIGAIVRSLDVGLQLQKDLPEIAEDYRRGMFISEIISKYDLCSRYGYNKEVIKTAVKYALKGYGGGLERDSFGGLLEGGELEKLAQEHKQRSGTQARDRSLGIHGKTSEQLAEFGRKSHTLKKGVHGRTPEQMSRDGIKSYELGVGIHGMSREQRIENAGKAGRRAVELGVGIHEMTREQRVEHARKITIGKGLVPWDSEESEYVYILSQRPEYRIQKGPGKGKINARLIAKEINESYHNGNPIRSRNSIKGHLGILRKQKDKTK